MNIVVSGYTAAGKSTHTRLLADALGYGYISAAEILLEKLGFDTSVESESDIWFHRNNEINRLRNGTNLDRELDNFLVSRASAKGNTVFDARFLPWLCAAPMIRIWLSSDLPSRARKCCVSVGLGESEISNCARIIHDKDNNDVARLASSHDIVFGPDKAVFDAILDNSSFISLATTERASDGIRRFHPYVVAVAKAVLGDVESLYDLRRTSNIEFADAVRFVRYGPPFPGINEAADTR